MDKFLVKYANYRFEDWCTVCSDDFKGFAREFKSYLERNLPARCKIVGHRCGHYDVYGFVKLGAACVCYSWTWDRFHPLDVHVSGPMRGVLVRYATDEHDHHGERNEFVSLERLPTQIAEMLERRNTAA